MAICEPFIQAQNAPCCIDLLTIGVITSLSSTINVFFENLTTGRKTILSGESDGSGLLTVDISDHRFPLNQAFRISASITGSDYSDRLDINISSQTEEYVHVTFVNMLDGTGEPTTDATYSLVI